MNTRNIFKSILKGVGITFLLICIYAFFATDYGKSPERIKILRDWFIYSDLNAIRNAIQTGNEQKFKNLSEFNLKYQQKIKEQFYCYYLSWSKSHYIFAVRLESKKYIDINKWEILIFDSNNEPVTLDSKIIAYITWTFCNKE